LEKISEQTGIEPEALSTYPLVPEAFKEYCDAFMILSSRRTAGFASMNPISLAEMHAYIQLYGMPSYGVQAFVDMMIRLDAKYLELTAKK
jgi:hypothetical protein